MMNIILKLPILHVPWQSLSFAMSSTVQLINTITIEGKKKGAGFSVRSGQRGCF